MNQNRSTRVSRSLIGALTVLLAFTFAVFAGQPASAATTASSGEQGMFQGPDGLKRGMAEAEGGLGIKFDLQPGDDIKLSEDKQLATIVTGDGTELVQFDTPKVESAEHAIFVFDNDVLTAVAANADGTPIVSEQGCPKASGISWGWSILWDGMVCIPFGIATGGVGGFLCGAAGSGISSFVPWDKVCG